MMVSGKEQVEDGRWINKEDTDARLEEKD